MQHVFTVQGSDIEMLGSEVTVEYGAELLERLPVDEAELQDASGKTYRM